MGLVLAGVFTFTAVEELLPEGVGVACLSTKNPTNKNLKPLVIF
jgi:hypothetical protein